MRINQNISAMNTYSRLTNANNAKSSSLAKLSSGLRINKAGDDAAGLAISEKMRGQISGLNQAAKNAQDGISLIQTAEGALNETHSILQRMRELAVQSASDTNTNADRGEIQKEMNELAKEASRIAGDTEFNTQKLLDGTFTNKVFHIGSNSSQNLSINVGNMDAVALGVGTSSAASPAALGEKSVVGGAATDLVLSDPSGTYNSSRDLDIKVEITTVGIAAGAAVADITINGETVSVTADAVGTTPTFTLDASKFENIETGSSLTITGGAAHSIATDINFSVTGVKDGTVESINISTRADADAAITTIDTAIGNVSAERSKLGAVQNRLDHTINNLSATSENLSAAESRIRDVDMAQEMMEFTKNNILSQAATSMLAQANQMPQSVLQLLQ